MIKINVYYIAKNDKDEFDLIAQKFVHMSSKFAKIQLHNFFNKHVSKAQTIGEEEAQKCYTNLYEPQLKNGYNIACDVLGKKINSQQFASLLEGNSCINIFIGGAFGFSKDFLSKCNQTISLSHLTFSHKLANIVLLEQIFRGLCINRNHPYHK